MENSPKLLPSKTPNQVKTSLNRSTPNATFLTNSKSKLSSESGEEKTNSEPNSPRRRSMITATHRNSFDRPKRRVSSKTADARYRDQIQQSLGRPSPTTSSSSLSMDVTIEKGLVIRKTPEIVKQKEMIEEKRVSVFIKTTNDKKLIHFFSHQRGDDERDEFATEVSSYSYSDSEESIRLAESEYEELFNKLRNYENETTEDSSLSYEVEKKPFKCASPSRKQSQRTNIVLAPLNKINEASIKAYKVWDNGIVNFHYNKAYEGVRFCYIKGCDESDPALRYVKNLTLTGFRQDYAGFNLCAIYRIIKFCPKCFQEYIQVQTNNPEVPQEVEINYKGYKLFSPL